MDLCELEASQGYTGDLASEHNNKAKQQRKPPVSPQTPTIRTYRENLKYLLKFPPSLLLCHLSDTSSLPHFDVSPGKVTIREEVQSIFLKPVFSGLIIPFLVGEDTASRSVHVLTALGSRQCLSGAAPGSTGLCSQPRDDLAPEFVPSLR